MTRKITDGAARIKLGLASELRLGNLDAQRDWGFAGDYVEAMWLMLQQETPDDYVVATGRGAHRARVLRSRVRARSGSTTSEYVRRRPASSSGRSTSTCSSATRPRRATVLGWEPKVGFDELVEMMVDADLERLTS